MNKDQWTVPADDALLLIAQLGFGCVWTHSTRAAKHDGYIKQIEEEEWGKEKGRRNESRVQTLDSICFLLKNHSRSIACLLL